SAVRRAALAARYRRVQAALSARPRSIAARSRAIATESGLRIPCGSRGGTNGPDPRSFGGARRANSGLRYAVNRTTLGAASEGRLTSDWLARPEGFEPPTY